MKFTLATKLTFLRLFLILPILALLYVDATFTALVLTILALLTDYFDGYIARKTNTITDLGAFLDHFADKLLVHLILLFFVAMHGLSAIALGILLTRDFYVLGIRHITTQRKKELPSMKLGKIKFGIQSILLVALILSLSVPALALTAQILLWASVFFAVISAIELTNAAKDIF